MSLTKRFKLTSIDGKVYKTFARTKEGAMSAINDFIVSVEEIEKDPPKVDADMPRGNVSKTMTDLSNETYKV